MNRLCIGALACAILFATPALADMWDEKDAISKTVLADRETDGEADKDKDKAEADADSREMRPSLRDRGREEAERGGEAPVSTGKWSGDGIVQMEQTGQMQVRDHSAPRTEQRSPDQQRNQRSSNVLGPLWGVPQEAPVMQHIDPELEKQYAKDSAGRLVPRETLSPEEAKSVEQQEREQRQADREAQFERDRQERAAKAEAKQREKEARAEEQRQERAARDTERQREREAAAAQREAGRQSQPPADEDAVGEDEGGDIAPGSEPADEAETEKPADEFRNHRMGGRSTPEDEGW